MSETESDLSCIRSDKEKIKILKKGIQKLIAENEVLRKEVQCEKQKCRMRKRKQEEREEIKTANDKKTRQEFDEISKMFEEIKEIHNLLRSTAQETNDMMMVVFGPSCFRQQEHHNHHHPPPQEKRKKGNQSHLLDENDFLFVRDDLHY